MLGRWGRNFLEQSQVLMLISTAEQGLCQHIPGSFLHSLSCCPMPEMSVCLCWNIFICCKSFLKGAGIQISHQTQISLGYKFFRIKKWEGGSVPLFSPFSPDKDSSFLNKHIKCMLWEGITISIWGHFFCPAVALPGKLTEGRKKKREMRERPQAS